MSFQLTAQQADNWYFGVYAGLNFSTSPPTVLTDGTINTPEGCASVSDASGALLFYTDGITVWNKQHLIMPEGTGLLGGSSSTQAALILKQPGSDHLYYLFTLDEIGGPFGFRYSIVDMDLQNNLGDVIEKNILLQNSVTEKQTAVTNYDGTKIWVVIHGWGTNTFYSYSLSSSGIDATPTVSNTGIVHSTSQIQNTYGQMKFAGCGERMALAAGYLDTVEIFEFNLANGDVSNPITIPMPDHVYGLEFSPDNSKLYVTCYDPSGTLIQFDVLQSTATAIINSAIVINTTEDLYAMQLAPDGKIYVVKSYSPNLGIINDPNAIGSACDFVLNGINLDPLYTGATAALGLPDFIQSDFDVFHKGCPFATAIIEPSPDNRNLIFPNPSTGLITLQTTSFAFGSFQLIISDLSGKTVFQTMETASGDFVEIHTSTIPTGMYLLHAKQGDKIILQKLMLNEVK